MCTVIWNEVTRKFSLLGGFRCNMGEVHRSQNNSIFGRGILGLKPGGLTICKLLKGFMRSFSGPDCVVGWVRHIVRQNAAFGHVGEI